MSKSKKTAKINLNISIDATKISEMFSTKDRKNIGVMPEASSLIDELKGFKNDVKKYHALIGLLIDNKMLISHCFIFLACSFGFMKPFPLHVHFTNSGAASTDVLNKIDKLKSLNSNVFKVKMISTDADLKYNNQQKEFFDIMLIQIRNKNISFGTYDFQTFCPNDAAHIIKRIRKRLISKKVLYLIQNLLTHSVSRSNFDILDPSIPESCWIDNSLATMDDFYPYQMYRPILIAKAIEKRDYRMVIYLIPSVAINLVLRKKYE